MITISFLGLDPFTSEHLSKDIFAPLAAIFDCPTEDIIVYAPESFLFHNGVDQTLWHALIHVHAPQKYRDKQAEVAQYLLKKVKEHVIHSTVEFYYYDETDRYQSRDALYPNYVTEANAVNVENEQETTQEVYQGDVFSSLNLDKKTPKKSK